MYMQIFFIDIGVDTIIGSWFRSEHAPFQKGKSFQKSAFDECRIRNQKSKGTSEHPVC